MTLDEAALKSDCEQTSLDSVLVNKATPEYLQELLKDKRQLQNFPNMFIHLEIILEKEINRVREKLFHLNESFKKTENELPEPAGVITTLQEKVFVPVKENPNYNFVGRLLGPRGLTAKQLEQDLECKIMVRGKGSLRDKKKEDMNRGKPNWEHLDEELHVLVSVEDYENRAAVKLRRATETIRNFLEQGVRTPDGEDELKKRQLVELAIINGTYRTDNQRNGSPDEPDGLQQNQQFEDRSDACTIVLPGVGLYSRGELENICFSLDGYKDRQQAHAHQLQQQQQQQQQQQLLLQPQTLLANPAAAAAAAQLLQTTNSAQTTSHFLARLQASPAGIQSLNAATLQLNPALSAGFTGSAAALQAAAAAAAVAAGGSGATLPLSSLASYFSNPGLTGTPIQASSASGGSALGFQLSQLPCTTASGLGLSTLPFSVSPGLTTSGSPNLISCTPGPTQDQYTALAAALLSGGTNCTMGNSAAAAQLTNGKVPVSVGSSKPSTSYYPMTSLASSLVDPVTIIDYNSANSMAAAQEMGSDSLKMRSISSGQNRMHPYLR